MVNHLTSFPFRQSEIEIRVRYQETDAQGRVHHANYVNYFEIGRVEMLRAAGYSYRRLEEQDGIMLVVTELSCRYYQPAQYDDVLRLCTHIEQARGVRIQHRYLLYRDVQLLAEGRSTVACLNAEGRVIRLPRWLTISDDTR